MGLVLAVSPAAGVYLGGAIVAGWGMHGVLTALALLAAVLLLLCCWLLPETRPSQHVHTAFLPLLRRMATDKPLALAVLLVAAFNVSLFSYYSLAPFIFAQLRQGSVILATAASRWPSDRWPGRCSIAGCCAKPSRKREYCCSPV